MRKSVESLKANSLEVIVSSKHLEEQCSNDIQKIHDRIVNKAHLPFFLCKIHDDDDDDELLLWYG